MLGKNVIPVYEEQEFNVSPGYSSSDAAPEAQAPLPLAGMSINRPKTTLKKAMQESVVDTEEGQGISIEKFAAEMGYDYNSLDRKSKRQLMRKLRARSLRNQLGKGASAGRTKILAKSFDRAIEKSGLSGEKENFSIDQLYAAGVSAKGMCQQARQDGHSWGSLVKICTEILRDASNVFQRVKMAFDLVDFGSAEEKHAFGVFANKARQEHISVIYGTDAELAAVAEDPNGAGVVESSAVYKLIKLLEKAKDNKRKGTPLFSAKMVLKQELVGEYFEIAANMNDLAAIVDTAYYKYILAITDYARQNGGTIAQELAIVEEKAKKAIKPENAEPTLQVLENVASEALSAEEAEPAAEASTVHGLDDGEVLVGHQDSEPAHKKKELPPRDEHGR
ncbi:MAG: hypothetical protein ACKO0Z_04235, partial [Betaproteobacteria bacterium]